MIGHYTPQPTWKAATIAADENAHFQLFDRVVNIRDGYTVPLGLRGTVIGIHQGKYNFLWFFSAFLQSIITLDNRFKKMVPRY